ncbi:uncharacterized protein N0V89_001799 [Didymosphaeria variabile]|uniref:Uncharacterized protein n=1 Tax=Didymosphaeria variabile TaxID=1932322 RepID=A0A9W8XRK2_9PLEO|nr:uncharacterized protein N0V89_001799 [Didymosphaeria variabile]KAJ4357224.1 hypothetical protein N0V89_001799 [Didymosphaeria variabile]
MKFISAVFVAATTLLATVSAIPAPSSAQAQNAAQLKHTPPIFAYASHLGERQSGGGSNALAERQLDPEEICARSFAEWRACREAAGCDRECPAGEACYKALCATPASTNGNACTQLRAKCGLVEKRSGGDSGGLDIAQNDKRQVVDDPNAAQAAHLVDIWTEPFFSGRYTWSYYSEMIASTCVDVSDFPVEWSSLKVNPQDTAFHCTFYDLPNCKDGAKSFTVDGTNGYEAPELRRVDGNWYHNVRSLKCEPGEMSVANKRQVVDDQNAAQGAHLIDIWDQPNYIGAFTFAVYSQMTSSSCVNVATNPLDWASFRIYPNDILFYCTFYAKPDCQPGGKAFTIADGTHGYGVPDLRSFGNGLWYHNIRSLKCQPGVCTTC